MTLGDRIRARRQDLRMTQEELATKCGYADKGMISRIESDQIDLPLSRIEKIAEVLIISPIQLCGWT